VGTLFVHGFICFVCWNHIWHMYKCADEWSMNLWMKELCIILYVHMSNMFLMRDIYVWNVWTHEWMNFTWFSLLNHWMLNLWCKEVLWVLIACLHCILTLQGYQTSFIKYTFEYSIWSNVIFTHLDNKGNTYLSIVFVPCY
jgi:hypothetical protein